MFEIYIDGWGTGLVYRERRLAKAAARELRYALEGSRCYPVKVA